MKAMTMTEMSEIEGAAACGLAGAAAVAGAFSMNPVGWAVGAAAGYYYGASGCHT